MQRFPRHPRGACDCKELRCSRTSLKVIAAAKCGESRRLSKKKEVGSSPVEPAPAGRPRLLEGGRRVKQAALGGSRPGIKGGARPVPACARHVAAAAAASAAARRAPGPGAAGRPGPPRTRLQISWRVPARGDAAQVQAHLRLRRPLPRRSQVLHHQVRRRRLHEARHGIQDILGPCREAGRVPQPAAAQAAGVPRPLLGGRRVPRAVQVLQDILRGPRLPSATRLLKPRHHSTVPIRALYYQVISSLKTEKPQETVAAKIKIHHSCLLCSCDTVNDTIQFAIAYIQNKSTQ